MSDDRTRVVLATKVYVDGPARERALDSLQSLIHNDVGDLYVDLDVTLGEDEFPAVSVTGPDATAAANLLRETWGEILPELEEGSVATGTLAAWDEAALTLDAGREVHIPTDALGLGQGTADQIRTRFGLVQHLPLEFVAGDPPRLSDAQRDEFYDWQRGNGRVNVNSATRAETRATVNRAGHAHDIVTVERLGLLEQSIVCTDDTDPPGLLASIGEYLPSELLCVV